MPLISVVIVTFNNQGTIERCINSINSKNPGCEIVVVDNNSSDKTSEIVKSLKSVKLIQNPHNIGFSKGVNLGVKESGREYLVLINPDAKLNTDNGLDKLVEGLDKNAEYGIIGPKFVNPSGSTQPSVRNFPTALNALKEYTLKIKGSYDFYLPKGEVLSTVETIYGACMAINKNVLQKVGGLDEKFFLYYEEIDLCKKLKDIGLKVGFEPSIEVVHEVGHSGIGQKTSEILIESAKRYHGLVEFYIIKLILRSSSILNKRLTPLLFLGVPLFWLLIIKLYKPTIFSSLTILNGINTLRGYGEEAGIPYILNWLLTNKIQLGVISTIHWLSYFQPSLYFNGWAVILLLPALYGVTEIVRSSGNQLKKFLLLLVLLAFPGAFYYPERLPLINIIGWIFWITITIYGIKKGLKR